MNFGSRHKKVAITGFAAFSVLIAILAVRSFMFDELPVDPSRASSPEVAIVKEAVDIEAFLRWQEISFESVVIPKIVDVSPPDELARLLKSYVSPSAGKVPPSVGSGILQTASSYSWKVAGFTKGGKVLQVLQGVCFRELDVSATFSRIPDGGPCVIVAIFDPSQRAIVSLTYNGDS
jgi:hypothetical protein